MPKTRNFVRCPLFGEPLLLKGNMLPTYCDVIKHYLWIRNDVLDLNKGKSPAVKDLCVIMATEIKKIWNKASIPTISDQQIVSRLILYCNKYKGVKKLRSETKKQLFYKDSVKKLFDIATCKCISREVCKCATKIPAAEDKFLKDQRNDRKMYIGSIDKMMTESIRHSAIRKRKYEEFQKRTTTDPSASLSAMVSPSSDSSTISSDGEEGEFLVKETARQSSKGSQQMRRKLQNLATACDRTGVSDRTAAYIVNAALLDLNVIGTDNSTKVIDRSKIRRERIKVRKVLQSAANKKTIKSIYFDGRKDKTLVMITNENTSRRKKITEEHISIISEPDSEYIGHLAIDSGKATTIEKNISDFLNLRYEFQSSLLAVGCDGTAVNTGRKNGVIVLLEKRLKRPLQWFVCLLHANELPLRHLFSSLDGTTTGPNSFSGCIGKSLDKCLDLEVEAFEPIVTELPILDSNLLSTDQNYLFQMCTAISNGTVSSNLASKDPGRLAHSRWLTCANRILRVYIGTPRPTHNLKVLAEFIMKVYAPTWFDIKAKSSVKYGPIHVFSMVKRCLYLSDDLKTIVMKAIQRNAFFAHPENVLLAMLQDSAPHIRELALRRVLKARKESTGQKVREFCLPKLREDAPNYYGLIDWASEKITEPPITMKYSDEEISHIIAEGGNFPEIEKYPCHSQAVERCVKIVTEASLSVCGSEARDGFIRTRIKARQDIPCFDTKCQYFGQKVDAPNPI